MPELSPVGRPRQWFGLSPEWRCIPLRNRIGSRQLAHITDLPGERQASIPATPHVARSADPRQSRRHWATSNDLGAGPWSAQVRDLRAPSSVKPGSMRTSTMPAGSRSGPRPVAPTAPHGRARAGRFRQQYGRAMTSRTLVAMNAIERPASWKGRRITRRRRALCAYGDGRCRGQGRSMA